MTTGPHSQRCRQCGAPITALRMRLGGSCERPECRIDAMLEAGRPRLLTELRDRQRRERAIAEQRSGERVAAVRQEWRRHGDPPTAAVATRTVIADVPANMLQLGPVPPERVSRFAANLRATLAAAQEHPAAKSECEQSSDPGDPPPRAEIEACTTCRGWCCQGGQEHAHLRPDTLPDYDSTYPELDHEGILQLYLDRVPEASYASACIFQAERGCSLPRELRSSTCNTHRCEAVQRLGRDLEQRGADRVLIGAFEQQRLRRMSVLESDEPAVSWNVAEPPAPLTRPGPADPR